MSTDRPLPLPFVTPVAGISHRQEVAYTLTLGAPVVLRREPSNPYDAHAVVIEYGDDLLGYLPRALAARLGGEGPWSGEVNEILEGQFIGIRIRVLTETPGHVSAREQRIATPSAPVPSESTDSPAVTAVPVHALSGRLLGTLAGLTDDGVLVRTEHGQVTYPERLVSIASVD